MASKHLDGLLQVAVPSREEAAALGRVDIRKDWRQRVVAHKGLAHAHRVRMPLIVALVLSHVPCNNFFGEFAREEHADICPSK